MILLVIPILIVLAGAGIYALFTSRAWQIILASLFLWAAFNDYFHQGPTQGQTTEVVQPMTDVEIHRAQWAAEDALWAKQHH